MEPIIYTEEQKARIRGMVEVFKLARPYVTPAVRANAACATPLSVL